MNMKYGWLLLLLCAQADAQEAIVEDFVMRAADYFNEHTLAESCSHFVHDPAWRVGELFPFVIDETGICYAFGDEFNRIGSNFSSRKDVMEMPLMQMFLMVGKKGGWAEFFSNNDYMYVYVKTVAKDGKIFIVGAGYYPHSHKNMAHNLVQKAIGLMRNKPELEAAFQIISNPIGILVRGLLCVTVFDDKGVVWGDGTRMFLGQNIFTSAMLPDNALGELRLFMQGKDASRWISFTQDGMTKRLYIERYFDIKSRRTYFVLSHYIRGITDDLVKDLVKKAKTYILRHDPESAFDLFNKTDTEFTVAGMKLFAFSPDGQCFANGQNPTFVGRFLLDRRDPDGYLYVKSLIDQTLKNGFAWTMYRERNAYKLVYSEKLVLADGRIFIIGSGYWPLEKKRLCVDLVERAVASIITDGIAKSFNLFADAQQSFLQGNIYISVYTPEGICLIHGPYGMKHIWRSPQTARADEKKFVRHIMKIAQKNAGWTVYKRNKGVMHAYIEKVPTGLHAGLIVVAGFYE